jgi:hypothetical protein
MIEYDDIGELKSLAGEIPKETCYSIDQIIKVINISIDYSKRIEKEARREKEGDNIEDLQKSLDFCEDNANDIQYELDGLELSLEELRRDNAQLRELGKFWYWEALHYYLEIKRFEETRAYKIVNFISEFSFREFINRTISIFRTNNLKACK